MLAPAFGVMQGFGVPQACEMTQGFGVTQDFGVPQESGVTQGSGVTQKLAQEFAEEQGKEKARRRWSIYLRMLLSTFATSLPVVCPR